MPEHGSRAPFRSGAASNMSEKTNESRLPPPAFPPGSRKHVSRNSTGATGTTAPKKRAESVDEAFISPDEPLPDRIDPFSDAFISPDEPLPERRAAMEDAFEDAHAAAQGEGEVVSMSMDAHREPDETVAQGDPHVRELMHAVAKLAEAVRRKGEAGLRATPAMSRFESTLRAYCVGYLAGRRAEEPPEPEMEEALPTDG